MNMNSSNFRFTSAAALFSLIKNKLAYKKRIESSIKIREPWGMRRDIK
jgi:hypothetical protein